MQKLKTIIGKIFEIIGIISNKKNNQKDNSLDKRENKVIISINKSLKATKKIRNPGIDFGRIISMVAIVIHHILYHGLAIKKFNQYKELKYLNIALYWHVNVFIFISGFVGHKTTKYSNLLYLWFCILFYTLGIKIYFSKYKPNLYKRKIEFNDFFPVINYQYWYFTAYFGMYLFLPVINKGIENIKKSQLKITILSFIIVFIVLQCYINPKLDLFQMNNGFSVIWHLTYYIIGSYFGKFQRSDNDNKKAIKLLFYVFIYCSSTYFCIKLSYYQINNNINNQDLKDKIIIFLKSIFIMKYTSVGNILQSISIILFLSNINYNKYISNIFSFIGPLTFGVYLVHDNNIVRYNIIRVLFKNYPKRLPLKTIITIIMVKALKIIGICLIIDYLRNILFCLLHIKYICILIEKLININIF